MIQKPPPTIGAPLTEEQIHEMAIALEASYLADGRIGRTGQNLADQFMAALPRPDFSNISEQRDLYSRYVRLANDQGGNQQAITYIRCKCVVVALEVAYIRGDLARDWRMEP
jgi:hypothetical protein